MRHRPQPCEVFYWPKTTPQQGLDAKHGLAISAMYEELTGGSTVISGTSTGCPVELASLAGACSYDQGPDPVSRYSGDNRREDWADSAAASIFNGGNVNSITDRGTNHRIYGSLSVDRGQAVQDALYYSYDQLFSDGGGKTTNLATE